MSLFICTSNQGKLAEFSNMLSAENKIIGIRDLKKIESIKQIEAIENSDYFFSNALIKILSALKYISDNFKIKEFNEIEKIIVDDSGLCVPALNFLPGVHSATYAGSPKDDTNNRKKLIYEIGNLGSTTDFQNEKRTPAFFVCFLIEIAIKDLKSNSIINYNIKDAKSLVNKNIIEFEEKCLHKVDFNSDGGFFTDKISIPTLIPQFISNFILNIHYGFCCGEVSNSEQNLIQGAGHGYDSLFYSVSKKDLSFASITMEEKNAKSHRAFAMKAMRGDF
ncbi:non-canonical purine NTP pyrophosphatase [Fluviispira multicolorata]|uniref:Non-canonical purine NTP pyrophosphatase n=1 Tax=Fluviispira multicolorata TaxID=2654512 RepID=A0A833N6U8_9BACT|nr:non-canonical purine NTP pyrophosphatase [Fluviispira multicolorata]KAB8030923.1 hypothetical protein GCL57_08095 [Fluviispira multicolorata]